MTGIANAYADRLPILVITGETSTHIFGKGGLQESSGEGGSIDQAELFKSITRYHKVVERTDYLANVLNQASKVLLSANSGPVLLSFPFNVQKELVDADLLERVVTQRPDPAMVENSRSIDALTGLILEARNPVIVAGYDCIKSGAQEQVSELSDSLNIPVTSSMKGKGVISEQSALSLGSLGVTSTGYAYKYIIDNADAIIFLGAGFNERTSYLWDETLLQNKKIAQVDSNPEQINKVFKADVAVTGDIKSTLNGVLQTMDAQGIDRQAVRKQIAANDPVSKRDAGSSEIFKSGFELIESFYKRLEKHFPKDLAVFDDNMIFAQSFFNVSSGNRFYPNSGISSLGHAILAAIGARFAEHKPTIAILGDLGRLKEGQCRCGSPFPLMELDVCRKNDLIVTPAGRTIYPSYFVHLLDGFSGIEQFQFEQQEPDSIVLKLCAGQDIADTVEQSLISRIQADLGSAMSFQVDRVESIPRSQSGKHRFVIGL